MDYQVCSRVDALGGVLEQGHFVRLTTPSLGEALAEAQGTPYGFILDLRQGRVLAPDGTWIAAGEGEPTA